MESKPFYKSVTLWINFIPLVIMVLQNLLDLNAIPASASAYVLIVINILNIAIRTFKTNTAIKL